MRTCNIFGFEIFADTVEKCHEILDSALRGSYQKKPCIVFTPNPEQLMLARRNLEFRENLLKGDVLIPDGVGLVKAGRGEIAERITGRETLEFLVSRAAVLRLPIFLLGGRESCKKYADKITAEFPGLEVGYDAGVEHITHESVEETQRILEKIRKIKPTIVCVAYGAPYQEQWVIEHEDFLHKVGVRVALVVGGAYDMLSGEVPTAPAAISQLGFEWLFRLIVQPWRWKRQIALIEFALLVLRSRKNKTPSK